MFDYEFPDFDLRCPMRRGVGSIQSDISAREVTGRNSGIPLPQPRRPRSRQPVLGQDRKEEIRCSSDFRGSGCRWRSVDNVEVTVVFISPEADN